MIAPKMSSWRIYTFFGHLKQGKSAASEYHICHPFTSLSAFDSPFGGEMRCKPGQGSRDRWRKCLDLAGITLRPRRRGCCRPPQAERQQEFVCLAEPPASTVRQTARAVIRIGGSRSGRDGPLCGPEALRIQARSGPRSEAT